jgi:hypothetical protein
MRPLSKDFSIRLSWIHFNFVHSSFSIRFRVDLVDAAAWVHSVNLFNLRGDETCFGPSRIKTGSPAIANECEPLGFEKFGCPNSSA